MNDRSPEASVTRRVWSTGAAGCVAALLVAGAARLPADPMVGWGCGVAVGAMLSLAAAASIRGWLLPRARMDAQLIALVDADASTGGLVESPVASAVDRLMSRHRERVERLRIERADVKNRLLLAIRVSEQSQVGLAIVERPEGTIRFANARFRELCHLRSDPTGRRPLEVVPAVEVHEAVESAMRGGGITTDFATGWGDMQVRVEPLDARHLTVRLTDITVEREAERSRSSFVANVSHELRTPITALMGYSETLLADTDGIPDGRSRC